MAKTHSQAVIDYNRSRDNLMCRPTIEEGKRIRAAAAAAGMSVQAYMLDAVRCRMESEQAAPTARKPAESDTT